MNIRQERCELLVLLVSATIIATLGAAGALFRGKMVLGMSMAVVFGLGALIPAWRIMQSDDWLNRHSKRPQEEKDVEPRPAAYRR